jgi:hypothetical protein
MSEVAREIRDVDLRGRWVNQNGSVLWIEAQADGRFSGRFTSRKGRAAKDKAYAVQGSVNGELASFAVDFRGVDHNLAAITSFAGRYAREGDGVERLHTVWVLARQYEDDGRTKPTQVWNSFITNSDVFEKREESFD